MKSCERRSSLTGNFDFDDYTTEELHDLKNELKDGTITKELLCREVDKELIKRHIKNHPYKITYLEKCDRWMTYVKDPIKKSRKEIKAPTEEALIKKLEEAYKSFEQYYKVDKNASWRNLYDEWIEQRRKTVANENTVLRDEQHFARYFEMQDFFDNPIKSTTSSELKLFCVKVINGETIVDRTRGGSKHLGEPLTRKEWNNIKPILTSIINLALERHIIDRDPFLGIKFDRGLFRIVKKANETQIYNTDEKNALKTWCWNNYHETMDAAFLVPIFIVLVGCRIAEAIALTWDSVHSDKIVFSNSVHVNKCTYAETVVEHTKTYKDRSIILRPEAIELLHVLHNDFKNSNCKYIFQRDGHKLKIREASYILDKYGKESGSVKSSHKLRKTCGSDMRKAGFTTKQIANYLGNSEEVFINNYSYDTDTDTEFRNRLKMVE